MAKFNIQTYFKTALTMHQSGKLRQARKLYSDILKHNPDHFESLFMVGQSWFQEKRFDKALEFYNKGAELQPSNEGLLLQRAISLTNLGKLVEAKSAFENLKRSSKTSVGILFHAARNLKKMGHFESAIQHYQKLLDMEPQHIQGLNNLGNLYQQVHEYAKSMECYARLLEIDDESPMTHCNMAGLLQKMGQLDKAERLYLKALNLDGTNTLAHYNLGVIQSVKYEHKKALEFLQKAIQLSPDNAKYLSTYANVLNGIGERTKATTLLQKLVKSGVKSEEPYIKLAKIWMTDSEMNKVVQLLEAYIHVNPYSFESYYILGIAHEQLNNLEKAESNLRKIEKHPEFALRSLMTLQLLYPKMGRVDRNNEIMHEVSVLLEKFVSSQVIEEEIPVYNLAYFTYDPQLVAKVTAKFSNALIKRIEPLRKRLDFNYQGKKDKIKIGYLSPYFNKHPAGVLIQGVLKNHDREKFEVFAYAINCREDEINGEIQLLADQYTEIGGLSSAEAASKINEDGVNILISLAGYNVGMKSEIPALMPAPIQLVAMDCHESLQCDFYDYVFKDEMVMTDRNRASFSEAIIYLPTSHFFNVELEPTDKIIERSDYGLPDDAFVYGCLNHPRKLNSVAISAWMTILEQTPTSVLWLYDGGFASFRKNIQLIASKHAIASDRIIFCGREHHRDHYKRMTLIDLFLDTPVYNGHTTCLEALWMEVPVLTLRGETVSARLCSSFLAAVEMDYMICDDEKQYIQEAVSYVNTREKLVRAKKQLKEAKSSSDFFNIGLLTKRMEDAFEQAWYKYEAGSKPTDFHV
ncbi:MAG: tetratricopeptide repeat protein [Ekhidna sp.]